MRVEAKRTLVTFLALAFIFVVFMVILMERRASVELGQARDAAAAGRTSEAVLHYFQALNWYAPWGSAPKAADELWTLGLEQFKSGRRDEAFQTLTRLRGGLLAARSFGVPREDMLEGADVLLASILAERMLGAGASREELQRRTEVYSDLYRSSPRMEEGWLLAAVLGFLVWVWAGFSSIFALFGDDRASRLRDRLLGIRLQLLAFLAGYALWLTALGLA
jgi:hypothetical protein